MKLIVLLATWSNTQVTTDFQTTYKVKFYKYVSGCPKKLCNINMTICLLTPVFIVPQLAEEDIFQLDSLGEEDLPLEILELEIVLKMF